MVMLKHVLMTRYSSWVVGVGVVRPVFCPEFMAVMVIDWGSEKSGTVDRASVGACAGVLFCVRDGCGRVRDKGILSVQCVYM
jgi:hypothetical protein